MKTILVPTDFSEYAKAALNFSIELSRRNGAKVILMHAHDLIRYDFKDNLKTLIDEHNNVIRQGLTSRLDRIKKEILQNENIAITSFLCDGNVTDSILYVAEKFQVDLIVMGTLGAVGLKTTILGSKATAVLRNSTIPVLIIPPNYKWSKPKNILIALKDEQEKPEILKPVFSLAKAFGTGTSLFMFTDEDEEAYEVLTDTRTLYQMKEALSKLYPSFDIQSVHISGKNFIKTIQNYISENKFDFLVMINHHDSWIHNLTGISVTQKMALSSSIPLLSINPE
jgi:nucleotide-binding universal stress UspA family protein